MVGISKLLVHWTNDLRAVILVIRYFSLYRIQRNGYHRMFTIHCLFLRKKMRRATICLLFKDCAAFAEQKLLLDTKNRNIEIFVLKMVPIHMTLSVEVKCHQEEVHKRASYQIYGAVRSRNYLTVAKYSIS